MNVAVIEVKKEGRYLDGTGRAYNLKSGKIEVNRNLANRLAEVNPDAISVVGSEPRKQEVKNDSVFD